MGEAWIGTQPLNEKSAGSAALQAGAAEIIIAPGGFMRMGTDSRGRLTIWEGQRMRPTGR
jgi:hypothetical protein